LFFRDIKTKKATAQNYNSNAFCASGAVYPNGTFMTFGGNGAVGPGGKIGSVPYPGNYAGKFDDEYKNADGLKSIRVINPCSGAADSFGEECQWFDDPSVLHMQKSRWYSTAETIADGSVVLIGGMTTGGYIARTPGNDNCDSGSENTFEFWPPRGEAQYMPFMCKTSGLNSYAHAFLMPSGNMFVQANYSTIMWDYNTNVETELPDMPGQIVRVYPASGATAMLPLTPKNNWTPTVLFCGGIFMDDSSWGGFDNPVANTWELPSSNDCQRITPEPVDGSAPKYVQDDDMLVGRTMGQFVIMPTGKLLVINGAANGTAGYADKTGNTPLGQMPFGMSLASEPVLTPHMYDPEAPAGKRWSKDGMGSSKIPRLYHSSALLLPDGSVMIAGSNPNSDVNMTVPYPTMYTAEYFYPAYFDLTRPSVAGIPKTLAYGGASFDLTVSKGSFKGSPNDAADSAKVVLIRPGWTTHGMSMGQRYLQLNSTYTVKDDGSFVIHSAQAPPNANLITPGPVLLFVVVNGIPTIGKMVTLGNGQIGKQPITQAAILPSSIKVDLAKLQPAKTGDEASTGSSATDANGLNPAEGTGVRSASSPQVLGLVAVMGLVAAFW
jgi:hypothetical protein